MFKPNKPVEPRGEMFSQSESLGLDVSSRL